MPEAKTKLTDASVSGFLNKIADQQVREDCLTVVEIMQSAARAEPRMWGSAIIGFGEHTIQYAGGREGKWMLLGFSPRKQNLTFYIGSSFPEHDALLTELGPHTTGKGCLYIKRLSDVRIPILRKLVNASVKHKLKGASAPRSDAKAKSAKTKTVARAKSKSSSNTKIQSMARSRSKTRKA